MKTTLFALCFFFATAAFGQSYPPMNALQFVDHTYHAAYHAGAASSNILGGSDVVVGHGEMALAEIPLPEVHETPLGDVARQVRQERLYGKKAQMIWENPIYGTKPVATAVTP
ncbi:MAG TPA: hypothetical protein VMB18_16900 [Terriglobales bacterium]|jgi:hypothetical protein|nr:hypothetical protein [Terriglobales bacterium]